MGGQKCTGRVWLMAALAAFLLMIAPEAVIGADVQISKDLENRIKNPKSVKNIPTKKINYHISVFLKGDPKLKDHKLKLTLKRLEGGEISVVKTLNSKGNISHKFRLGTDPRKAYGTYYLEATEGPKLPPDPNRLNVCFDGIRDAPIIWHIDANNTALRETRLLTIEWSIGFNNPRCW